VFRTLAAKGAESLHDFPQARSTRLLVEELDGDLLVYDQDADTAHALTDQVARVWQCCNGKATVDSIARELALDEATVARALDELADCDLLLKQMIAGHTRRDAVTRAMKVGAAAASAPLIYSMAIGPASAMATPIACATVVCTGVNPSGTQAKILADNVCKANANCRAASTCNGTFNGGTNTYTGVCVF
jgi:hypothetical protein